MRDVSYFQGTNFCALCSELGGHVMVSALLSPFPILETMERPAAVPTQEYHPPPPSGTGIYSYVCRNIVPLEHGSMVVRGGGKEVNSGDALSK